MSFLEIEALGGIRVTLNGRALTGVLSHKAAGLLTYLAMNRRPHSRDALAALLWGEMPDADAKTNLRQALTRLRKVLEPHLRIARDTLEFNAGEPYRLDVEQFEAALGAGKPCEAIAHYDGDFLHGLFVRDAPDFEEWALAQRAHLRDLAGEALSALLSEAIARGDYPHAVDHARRLLSLDPWREEAHRELMLLFARTGQRSAALAQFETCRRMLAEHLGVEPSAETRTWYERIRASAGVSAQNLPPQATSFVGREGEVAQLETLLLNPDRRLVTLVGPGGIGKTRLALAAAARLHALGAFLDGVFFVPLAVITDERLLASAIADACGLALDGWRVPAAQVIRHLRGKEALILLDSFEHLLGAASWLSQLLHELPLLKLLVTSRERLNVQWEWAVPVDGLDVPVGDHPEVDRSSAVRLFCERAGQACGGFALDPGNTADVVRICRMVEGMPLGIELAAAWTAVYDGSAIVRQIERGYETLASSQRDVPLRLRSLRAVFEHSWQLLPEAERGVFRRLSVFRGGFTTQAAAAVAGAADRQLPALVNKSLLKRSDGGRYEQHEMMRQFAAEKLTETGEAERMAAEHAHYFAGWLDELYQWMADERQAKVMPLVAADLPNVRAAWAWLYAHQDWPNLTKALTLTYRFHEMGRFQDGIAALSAAREAAAADSAPPLLRARLSILTGVLLWRAGRFVDARAALEAALPLTEGSTREALVQRANVFHQLGSVSYMQGDFAAARQNFLVTIQIYRDIQDKRRLNKALSDLAAAEAAMGNLAQARAYYHEALGDRSPDSDLTNFAVVYENLGELETNAGNYDAALGYFEQALPLFRQFGDRKGELDLQICVAELQRVRNEPLPARAILAQIEAPVRALGPTNPLVVRLLKARALLDAQDGQTIAARAAAGDALRIASEVDSPALMLVALSAWISVLSCEGQTERAVQLGAVVLAHPASDEAVRAEARRALKRMQVEPSHATTAIDTDLEPWLRLLLSNSIDGVIMTVRT